jgi:hypothetical protein
MLMFHIDLSMRRFSEIIDSVVRADVYKYRTFLRIHIKTLCSTKIANDHPHGGYHSFNLYHMPAAFYLL